MRDVAEETRRRLVARIEEVEKGRLETRSLRGRTADGHTAGRFEVSLCRTGELFEQASCVVSHVEGELTPRAAGSAQAAGHVRPEAPVKFRGEGLVLVLHAHNPFVPSTRAHYNYFEREDGYWWFSGGADLTPFYLDEEGIRHFHRTYKAVCDRYDSSRYASMKKASERHFRLRHRGELRGVGGIFFNDFPGLDADVSRDAAFEFVRDCCGAIGDAYLPLVRKGMVKPYSDHHVEWMEFRKGRYIEFDLMYDRGITFGLEAGVPADLCLMALPTRARFDAFRDEPKPGTPEAEMLAVLRNPRDWVGDK